MKIYISADIEGISGVTDVSEVMKSSPDGKDFLEQMSLEVAAACEGAMDAGATEIVVKDAHGEGRNIIPSLLPEGVQLIRSWSGHPYQMMEGLDSSFDAAMMIGYHARAGSEASPRAHTINGLLVNRIRLNGQDASEFFINYYNAALTKVPVVFVSGDEGICDEVKDINPAIATQAVKWGMGDATRNLHPKTAVKKIKEGAYQSLREKKQGLIPPLPGHFKIEVKYAKTFMAYKRSFYPGAKLHPEDPSAIVFESDRYFEILRFLLFVVL